MVKPKAPRPRKRRLAPGLRELGDEAIKEHLERPCSPRILIQKTKDGWEFASPYREIDRDRWTALLFQAFGTRHLAVMTHFLGAFTKLVGVNSWDEKSQTWMPDQDEFDAVVAMVHAFAPQNVAQAAHAAQLVALHLSAMKLGENCAQGYGDDRSRAILNKTVRAYGEGMERMARVQGKIAPRTVNQTIEVHYYDDRDQRRLQIDGGVSRNGGQAHGTDGGALIQCAALPSPCPDGEAMPIASGEGQAGLPDARRGKRHGRAKG